MGASRHDERQVRPDASIHQKVHEEYSRYYSDRYYTLLDYVMDELYPGEENEGVRYKIYQAID